MLRALEDRARATAAVDRERHPGQVLAEMIARDAAVGEVERVISVDSSEVRAHQHAAAARKKRAARPTVDALTVGGEGLGRSRSRPRRADRSLSKTSCRRARTGPPPSRRRGPWPPLNIRTARPALRRKDPAHRAGGTPRSAGNQAASTADTRKTTDRTSTARQKNRIRQPHLPDRSTNRRGALANRRPVPGTARSRRRPCRRIEYACR
jgi:hypothetical protein